MIWREGLFHQSQGLQTENDVFLLAGNAGEGAKNEQDAKGRGPMQQSAKIDGHSADMGTGGDRQTQASATRTSAHAKGPRARGASPPLSASTAAVGRTPDGHNGAARAPQGTPKLREEQHPKPPSPVLLPARPRLTLERVLGVTVLSNAMMAVNPVTGELAYAAGCIVVVYNLRRNKQVRYYRVDKSVACLCFSPNGQFLAIGEKGYLPAITIWDGTQGTLCAELQRHQYGIACMAFSGDGRYLVSVGLVHDQHIYAWGLTLDEASRSMQAEAVGVAYVEDKVMAADYCQAGDFFVTVGEKHFKYWFLDDNGSFLVTGLHINDLPELQHRDAVISAKTSATFTGVGCGYGTCKLKTFAVTADGTLCCFGASGIMERLVSLEATCGNALSVTEAYVAVGGSSAVVRLFDPSTLEYRATMPFPPAFGTANDAASAGIAAMNGLYPDEPHRYPAVTAVRVTGSHVITLYSDRSLFINGIADLDAVTIERSFLFHSGGIRDVQVAGRVRGINAKGRLVYQRSDTNSSGSGAADGHSIPNGTFVTCSDDNTVRLWHLELHRRPVKSTRFDAGSGAIERPECDAWKNPYSQEMLRVIYNDPKSDFMDDPGNVLGGTCSHVSTTDIHSPVKSRGRVNGLRTVAIRPDARQIAAGDREGNVVVLSLPFGGPDIHIGAHSSEVSCLSYAELVDGRGPRSLMASGGKDRLVHLYDCDKNHAVMSTLENHEGAITSVAFTRNGDKILSCGADKNVVFSDIDETGKVVRTTAVPFVGGKIFDMVLTSDSDIVATACNNRLDILSCSTGKRLKTHHVGEQHHVAICPANFCVAMSGSLSDRTIHVVNIETGEALATGTGHGEAITGLKFTPDCRRLLSTSGDGCIFVWRLSEEIQGMIKSNLPRMVESQGAIPPPPVKMGIDLQMPTLLPPAPPVSARKKPNADEEWIETATTAEAQVAAKPHFPSPKETPAFDEKKRVGNERGLEATTDTVAPTKGEPKSSPVGSRKERAIAVSGPMADIPMDDWMRTRETSKLTVRVANDGGVPLHSENCVADENGRGPGAVLSVDRSQTPDWAKTDPSLSQAEPPVKSSPPPSVRAEQKVSAGEKWISRSTPVLLKQEPRDVKPDVGYLRGDGAHSPLSEMSYDTTARKEDAPQRSPQRQSGSPKRRKSAAAAPIKEDELNHLSVKELKINTNASTSLALEREKLEKRKKQMNTAKAVTAMNMRLSQLGLLRPQHKSTLFTTSESKEARSPPSRQSDTKENDEEASLCSLASDDKALNVNVPPATITSDKLVVRTHSAPRKRLLDIPVEMFESIEISSLPDGMTDKESPPTMELHPSNVEEKQDKKTTEISVVVCESDSTKQSLPQALSEIDESSPITVDAKGELVDRALNELSESYATAQADPGHRDVAASLSVFIAGYESENPTPLMQLEKVNQTGVALEGKQQEFDVEASFSAFTNGFATSLSTASGGAEAARENMDVKASMAASMSAFTSGYAHAPFHSDDKVHQEGESVVAMDMSMSTFTTGYQTANTFTPGISAARVHDSACDWELVGASYSNFTRGYGASNPTIVEEPSTDVKASAAEGVQSQTHHIYESLSTFTTGYGIPVSPLSVVHSPGDSSKKSVGILEPSLLEKTVDTGATALKVEEHGSSDKHMMKDTDPVKTVALTAISALEQPLLDVSATLDALLLERQNSDAGPELQEVQRLTTQLRDAIGRLGAQLQTDA